VRGEAKDGVSGRRDERYLDRRGIHPGDCAFERLIGDPAWLKPDEGGGKIVSPAPKRLVRALRVGRPLHEHLEHMAITKGPALKDIFGYKGGQILTLAAFSNP
jgi:hypothetical protein